MNNASHSPLDFKIIIPAFVVLLIGIIILFLFPRSNRIILKVAAVYRAFSAVPMVCVVVLVTVMSLTWLTAYLLALPLSQKVLFYVGFTFASIILTTVGNRIIGWWHQLNEKPEITSLSLKIANQARIRYLIFLLYFGILIYTSINSFSGEHHSNSDGFDKVALQSFATYISFDRLQSNWKTFWT